MWKCLKKQYTVTNESANTLDGSYDENIFFIPTKACLNEVKIDYQQMQAAFFIKHPMEEIKELPEYANVASGRIWVNELNKIVLYRDLINHTNEKNTIKMVDIG